MADTEMHLGTGVTLPNPTAYATNADWMRHRTRIQDLYRERSLKRVMQIMESEHSFKATPKMYKTHIKQWGLDKKNKEPEMIAVVHKHTARVQKGKASEFHIRGKALPFAEIVRYWQRKGLSIDDVVAQRAASKTPETIECFTPPFSPLSTPEELAMPERICIVIRDYHNSSFEAGVWTVEDEGHVLAKADQDAWSLFVTFTDECNLASILLQSGHFEEAGKVVISATANIKAIVQAQVPELLPGLLDALQPFRTQGRPEVSSAILRQFSGMGEILLGQEHPLKLLCGWLASASETVQEFFEDVAARSIRAVHDVFEAFLGPLHVSTLDARLLLLFMSSETDFRSWETSFQELLYECEHTLGSHDNRTLHVRLVMTAQYLQRRRFKEASKLAETLSAQTENGYYRSWGVYTLACSQYRLGNTEEAENNLRAAIRTRKSLWGGGDARVQGWMLKLRDWLEDRGDLEAAVELERVRVRLLELTLIDRNEEV